MYFSYVCPILECADVIWDNCPKYIKEKLEPIYNNEAARIITGATKLWMGNLRGTKKQT
jgi:hypothetical protein